MLLVCDIGNSNIVFGLYDSTELTAHWRITSRLTATVDEYIVMMGALLGSEDAFSGEATGAIISSVVPPLTPKVAAVIERLTGLKPLIVGPGVKTGLDVQYDDPREVGADRIVNAVGALTRHDPPLIIVDFGTATTFDVIHPPNVYIGGVIFPGLYISRDALVQRTALLPKVELRGVESIVGRTTADAIKSGLYYGTGALVDGVVDAIAEEQHIDPTVIATGGYAALIQESSARIETVESDLTLWGLRQIWQRNNP
jgi:type III pantothenate kinase